MKGSMALWVVAAALLTAPEGRGQVGPDPLAVVNGVALTEADVRAVAAEELARHEQERLRFEAESRTREHSILEEALKGMIADRLLTTESETRGVSVEALLDAEVDSRLDAPNEAEVEELYEINRQRLLNVSREQGMEQVRAFLAQRDYDLALEAFLESLREKYGVESNLGPYRVELDVEGHPVRGPSDAPVTIVEFSDFECPFCRQTAPVLNELQELYEGLVRVVYRQFPLVDIHPRAQKAAEASLCAHDQDAFWTMHDLLFAMPVELEPASLKAKAAVLGLDADEFNTCLDSSRHADTVAADIRAGFAVGVSATPTIFINGRPLTGAQPFETYRAIIEEELELIN